MSSNFIFFPIPSPIQLERREVSELYGTQPLAGLNCSTEYNVNTFPFMDFSTWRLYKPLLKSCWGLFYNPWVASLTTVMWYKLQQCCERKEESCCIWTEVSRCQQVLLESNLGMRANKRSGSLTNRDFMAILSWILYYCVTVRSQIGLQRELKGSFCDQV